MKKLDEVAEIDPDMIAEIDLHENAVYVVKEGHLFKLEQPEKGFGKQEISWQHGKVTNYELKCTYKI